jgi:cell division protein FtsB
MQVAIDIKKSLRAIFWPLAFACIAVYFGVHLVRNDHGLLALQAYDLRLAAAEERLGELVTTRVMLERETSWLQPGWTHPDSLGEQARVRLGMGSVDEVVILSR